MKHNNICVMGIPKGEESRQAIENLFKEIMTENFPSLVNETPQKSKKLRESQTRWAQTGRH